MLLLAAAVALVACGRAPDFDEAASTGRFELKFTAHGDFEFTLRNGRLELEVFEGGGPASVVCVYTQRVPPAASIQARLLEGARKPKVVGERIRFENAEGPYEVWFEWTNEHALYRSPRPDSVLPGQRLRQGATVHDNKLVGAATLTAVVKAATTVYIRGAAVHASPPLPNAKLGLSQPLPGRALARFKASAAGCKAKVVESPEAENGFTAVVMLMPARRPRECTLSVEWRR